MSSLLDVKKQLVFYGAYHSNKVNVLIHMVGVPLLVWTFQIILATFPTPSWFPSYRHEFNSVLSFEFNWAVVQFITYLSYYFALLPSAAILYVPQSIISLLTAIAVSRNPTYVNYAIGLHVVCWLAQFYGHGVHERRAPALFDNLIGAVVLAPFFVHLEILFDIGYFPQLHKAVVNGVGVEIAKFRSNEAAKKKSN